MKTVLDTEQRTSNEGVRVEHTEFRDHVRDETCVTATIRLPALKVFRRVGPKKVLETWPRINDLYVTPITAVELKQEGKEEEEDGKRSL